MLPVYWLTRIVIAAACTIVVFLFTNKDNASAKQQLKDNLDIYKKQNQQEEEYVEVEEK